MQKQSKSNKSKPAKNPPKNLTDKPQNNQVNQLVTQDTDNAVEIDNIYNIPQFPYVTNTLKFTPNDVKQALQEYENTDVTIVKVLKKYGIRLDSFYLVLNQYSIIREHYKRAQKTKSSIYGSKAVDMYNNIPEWCFETDRHGCSRLSTAGVKYIKDKHDAMLRQAEIHETGSYRSSGPLIDQSTHIHQDRAINVSINAADVSDLGKLFDSAKSAKK